MTRRAIVQKWILFCLCALVLLAVQDLILVRIRIGGVHPFLLMGKELLLSLAATPLAHISFYKVFRLTRSA